jgi:hypothetical protein
MSNFTSITKDDWFAYLPLALLEKGCQAKAKALCGDEALSPDQLGWEPLYCQEAVDLLIETPTMDLTNASTYPGHPDLSCCMEALECAKTSKWNLECAYTIGCGGASAAMLLVVLFSAWIYISLHASSANRGRSEEANLLRDQFKDEFVIVHVQTTHRAWATRAWQEAWAGLSVDGARALRIHRPALVMTRLACSARILYVARWVWIFGWNGVRELDGWRTSGGIVQTESESESVVSFFVCSFALVCCTIHSDH